MPASLPARVSYPPGCHHIGVFVPHFDINIPDAAQALMCPAINVVFLSWVHFLMHGGIVGTLLPFIGGSLPALLVANWKVYVLATQPSFGCRVSVKTGHSANARPEPYRSIAGR